MKTTLIATPRDQSLFDCQGFVTEKTKDLNFHQKEPAYCWIYPRNFSLLAEKEWIPAVIQNYATECTELEQSHLIKRKNPDECVYLRFMMFQDSEEGIPYVYGYLRKISNCTFSSHKEVLQNCPFDCVPVEVNLATYGLFIYLRTDAWKSKKISNKDITVVD
jgi:hypothetical protein